MAREDSIPDSYKNLHDWSAKYSTGVSAVATRIGWPTASVTTLKGQSNSLNVYMRAAGTANWTLLSDKRFRFPFHDDTPDPAGETTQAREYMVMGVIADEEICNPSNIAGAVFQN